MKNPKVGECEWRKMEGCNYSVSSLGEIRSDGTGKTLKGGLSGGYRAFTLVREVNGKSDKFTVRLHHVVMHTFVGPRPPGMVINHKNGVKTDNRLENLEYCTPRDNIEHAKAHRLYKSGSRCSWSKLCEEEVSLIRRAYQVGLSLAQLSRAFKVDRAAILQILKGRTWKYV